MIKFLLCQGIGFSPGSAKYLPTLGFATGAAPAASDVVSQMLLLGVGD